MAGWRGGVCLHDALCYCQTSSLPSKTLLQAKHLYVKQYQPQSALWKPHQEQGEELRWCNRHILYMSSYCSCKIYFEELLFSTAGVLVVITVSIHHPSSPVTHHFPEAHSNGVLTFPYNIGIMLLFAQGEAV